MAPRFLNVLDLCVTGAGYNHGLVDALRLVIPSYFVRRLVTIHKWHLAVHKDQSVVVGAALHPLPHFVKSILPIVSKIDNFFNVIDAALFENYLHSQCVEGLVVDNEYSLFELL